MRFLTTFAVLVLLPAAAGAQQPCVTDSRRVVNAAYQQILGRAPGADGTALARQLDAGSVTVRDVVRQLALSPEYRRRFLSGATPDARTTAVTNLYTHVLGRQPDPDGLRAHVDALSAQGIDDVVQSMLDSPEYQNAYGSDTVPGSRVQFCGPGSTAATRTSMRFRGMDRNGNGAIERNEWNGTQQSFLGHDWNRDGVLSGDEVRSGSLRNPREAAENDFDPSEPWGWTQSDFAQMDRNRDNRITSAEWFYDAEAFLRADRDRNGALSLSEFTAPLDDDRGDRFENLDVNNNGRVERGEWHASWDAFEWLDRNRDNVLSRNEVLGEAPSPVDGFNSIDADGSRTISVNEWRWSRRSFDRLDVNRDGVVSRQEFAAANAAPRTAVPR